MKICIFGAGAIGGLMGAKLAAKGDVDVTFIARGPHLAAMRENGVKLISEGTEQIVHPRCVESAEEAWEVLAGHYGFDLPPTESGAFAEDV